MGATKQRNQVRISVEEAMFSLWELGSESHEAAMAEDKLREAEFWISRIQIDKNIDEVVE